MVRDGVLDRVRVLLRVRVAEGVLVAEGVADGVSDCDLEAVCVGVAVREDVCEGVDVSVPVCDCVRLGESVGDDDCVSDNEAVIVADGVCI